VGTWQSVKQNVREAASWNHWPIPPNWVTDIRTLVCNDQTLIVQIKLAFALSMEMFFTELFPSPREIERKFFTGGYRCGFVLDVKVKSPIEIIFGKGTATMIAEMARPAITGLYYFWMEQTAISALSRFMTVIYPELFCEAGIGDGLRKADRAPFGAGHIEGVPGLGVEIFDYKNLLPANAAIADFPAGYWHAYAAWFINPSPWPLTGLKLGIRDLGGLDYFDEIPDVDDGLPRTRVTEAGGFSVNPHAVEAWMQGDKPMDAFPQMCTCVMFTVSWSPTHPIYQGNILQPYDQNGPPPPPLCSEFG